MTQRSGTAQDIDSAWMHARDVGLTDEEANDYAYDVWRSLAPSFASDRYLEDEYGR